MNKGFLKRLGWYLLGFSVGLLFLTFFLKKKSGDSSFEICYFPNCRVLKDIRYKPISYKGDTQQFLHDSVLWHSFFKDGTIDFSTSNTKAKPCKTYTIINAYAQKVLLKNCLDSVVVESFIP